MAKFLTVEFPPEHGKHPPQFRFLNESLITNSQAAAKLGLITGLAWSNRRPKV
jgi:hypothetical protein